MTDRQFHLHTRIYILHQHVGFHAAGLKRYDSAQGPETQMLVLVFLMYFPNNLGPSTAPNKTVVGAAEMNGLTDDLLIRSVSV